MSERSRQILLVEDNEDDAFLTKRVLRSAGILHSIHECRDGPSAIEYLTNALKDPEDEENGIPDLILLDLKIPRVSGLEVLGWIRGHEVLHSLFVLTLTSSREDRDVKTAYDLKINGYLVKPCSLVEMTNLAHSIRGFWLDQPHLITPLLNFPRPPEMVR